MIEAKQNQLCNFTGVGGRGGVGEGVTIKDLKRFLSMVLRRAWDMLFEKQHLQSFNPI